MADTLHFLWFFLFYFYFFDSSIHSFIHSDLTVRGLCLRPSNVSRGGRGDADREDAGIRGGIEAFRTTSRLWRFGLSHIIKKSLIMLFLQTIMNSIAAPSYKHALLCKFLGWLFGNKNMLKILYWWCPLLYFLRKA